MRIQVRNRTHLELSVWLDNCDGHLRLGDLPPGTHQSLRLPTLLIPFNNQLHFHTFDHEGDVRFASYAVDLAADWTLTLDIDESTPQLSLVFGPESTPLDRYVGLDAFMTYPGETLSYASRMAVGSPAVITWQCVEGERQITLSTGGRLPDAVGIAITFDGGYDVFTSTWFVQHGYSDSALAADTDIEFLTTHALLSQSLTVETGVAEGTTSHSFRMSGLLEALEELTCFGSFLVGPGG